MNPILKLVQQVKDAEGITLASVIKKVEDIRVSEDANRGDIKKVANALVVLKKEVDGIPLTSEVKKLQKAISDATERVEKTLNTQIKEVKADIRATETKLRQEIEDRIPDIITVTEKVTEVAKALDDAEIRKVLDRAIEPEFIKKVRDVFESFEGDDRMDAKAIKNLPQMQVLSNAGGGSNLSVFSNGTFVSSSTRLNFVGATVTDEGGRTKVTITGGGSSTFLDLTDTPSAYTGQAGKVVAVNGTEDGLEFIAATGVGTVTSVAVSGSDGIEVDSGSPITAAGTIALGLNKATTLTFLNVADGAQVNAIDSVTDTAEIDLAITAKALSASIIAGSIDETKLDASVNASLDLADTSFQKATIVAGSLTAANDTYYVNTASATYTDPSPTEGKGFIVFVRNGTATVGGTGYATAGTIIHRIYHSGAWANYVYQVSSTFLTSANISDTAYGAGWNADTTNAPSKNAVYDEMELRAPKASPTFTGTVTTPAIVVSSETASTLASFDASKNVKSLATASYPSLTEIAYVKGVTSAIQTQLNAKLATADIDDTPVNGETAAPISSNWAFDHAALAASDTVVGHVELAIASEINTGTDATRAVTPDALAGSTFGIRYIAFELNGTTALTTSDKAYKRIPPGFGGMNLVSVRASVGTGAAGSSSSGIPTFTVKNITQASVSMLTTNLTVDASEYTSATAATPAVIDTANDDVATDDLIEIAVTTAGTGVTYAVIECGFQLP